MSNAPAAESASDLRQLLFERSRRFKNIVPFSCHPDRGSKWIYASGLQKAIRRGRSEVAAICADALSNIDPGYIWRRLPIIALEDVGFGNKMACALVLEAAKSRSFRQKLGERQVLFFLVDELCSSVKDRSLCDLLVLNQNRPPPTKLWCKYVEGLHLPFVDSYLAKNGLRAANLGVQVPLLYEKIPEETCIVEDCPDSFGDELIAGLPACTYDMYTHEGKRACAYFAKSCPPVREFFSEHPSLNVVDSIGLVMFLMESAVLDRHLQWNGRDQLLCCSWRRDFEVYGLNTNQAASLQSIAKENRALFNDARRTVIRPDT